MTSIKQINDDQRNKYKTLHNIYEQFPVGTHVQIIVVAQDFTFFSGTETGVVIKNSGNYLGIIVAFDPPLDFMNDSKIWSDN